MQRINKEKYPGDKLFDSISNKPFLKRVAYRVLPDYLRRQNAEQHAYENYGSWFHRIFDNTPGDKMFEIKRKRYLQEATELLALMQKNNIDLSKRTVLDVSGGPGTFAYFIKESVKQIAVSEYAKESVIAMSEYLKDVEVFVFDLNSQLSLNKVYDVLLYRSCLYFCRDFRSHLKEISKYLSADGLIYVCTTAPSLGNTLRWQYEDYTHDVLYSPKVVEQIFHENNYSIIDRGVTDYYAHFLDHYSFRDKLFHSWGIWNWFIKGVPKNFDAKAFWILARKN